MATFTSPCTKEMLLKLDSAPMPTPVKSTYQTDYISLKDRQKLKISDIPQTPLPKSSGYRLMPTKYTDFYEYCISASIGEKLDMKFQDDTPKWKYGCRDARKRNWLHPISDRRNFIETQQWNLKKIKEENLIS